MSGELPGDLAMADAEPATRSVIRDRAEPVQGLRAWMVARLPAGVRGALGATKRRIARVLGGGTAVGDLAGDRDVEWSWVAARMGVGPGAVLDFGNGGSALGLIAAERGYDVTAVDLGAVDWPYAHDRLRFERGDVFDLPLPKEHFDLVLNCSSIEHVGLAGRYGLTESRPDGDLEAMIRLRELMKPGGTMLLTVPVGRDAVFMPLHRVYGAERLPRLLSGFTAVSREFWLKRDGRRWRPGDEREALAFVPRERLYGIGCFELRRS